MTDTAAFVVGVLIFVLALVLLFRSMVTIQPYQQGLVLRLGKYKGTINQGFNLVSPLSRVIRVDLRPKELRTPAAPFNTGSGVVLLGVIVRYRITDAARATFLVPNIEEALIAAASTALVGSVTETPKLAAPGRSYELVPSVTSKLTEAAVAFGVKVESVSIPEGPFAPPAPSAS